MKNDHFYEDDERFYNLNYTHDQLRDLLNKIDKGCILTKEQYTQLIEEIGLDNISTFDLNYYHLKNLPIIPVRVSELFNDVGYDVRKRVDAELETIYGLIEDDTEQLNNLKKYLEDINMAETLISIDKANDRVEYLNEVVTGINGVVFSFERSIDLIKDIASELSIEFEILKHRQDSNEELMGQANNKTLVNANDIIKLTELYHTLDERHNKIDDQFKQITDDVIERDEAIYVLISSLNKEMEAMEDLLKIFNPDDVDTEFLLNITESINNLKNEVISINENLELKQQQINAIELLISDYKTIIDSTIVVLQETDANLQANIDAVNENLNSQINVVTESIANVEKEVDANTESIIDIYDKQNIAEEAITGILTDIQNLDNKSKELEQDIIDFTEEVNNTFNELNDSINEVSNKIEANSQDIDLNKLSIVNLEKTNVDIIEDLNEIRNDISENINNINLTNEEIAKTNNALNETNTELNNTKERVTKTEADIESLTLNLETHHTENAERIKEVDETVEDLNSRIGSCDANILTFEARITDVEENITTLATKETVDSIQLQMHINEQGFVVVELLKDDVITSSIIIPYNVKFEEQIAKTDSARTDYSKTI